VKTGLKFKSIVAILVMIVCCPATLFAQSQITVTGVVTDTDNEPCIGATLMVDGSEKWNYNRHRR